MVFHVGTIHLIYTMSRLHSGVWSDVTIVHGHHDRCRLECGAWLHEGSQGIVACLVVVAVIIAHEVDDGFDIPRLHFHQNDNPHLGIELMQFLSESTLADVLHAHVYRAHEVITVHRLLVHDGEIFGEDSLVVFHAWHTSQHRVIGLFES